MMMTSRTAVVCDAEAAPKVAPPVKTPALETRWGRLLIPSLTDLFLLALIIWMFCVGAGWQGLLEDGDTGWHIRTGQYILHHHAVPTKDLFSFSKPDEPWFAWEWLTDVAYAGLHGWAGMKGITLFSGLLIAGFPVILLRHLLWRGANPMVSVAVTFLVIGAASIHYHGRPHLVTLFLLPIGMWMIDADRRAHSRRLWLLIPLTILWTNLHGGVFAFIATLGLLVVGLAIEAALEWKTTGGWEAGEVIRYTVLAGLCSAATLVNPYGYGLHVHVAEYLSSDWIKEVVMEFQSPNFRFPSVMQFEVLVFAGLLACNFLLRERRVPEALWILYWAHSGFASARHVPLYAIVAAPMIASEATKLWSAVVTGRSKKSLLRLLNDISIDLGKGFQRTTVWLIIFIAAFVVLDAPIRWPKDFSEHKFPLKMVASHEAWLRSGRVLTTDQWADYLIYKFYPNMRVFADGRSDFYGPGIGKQYLAVLEVRAGWEGVLERHKIDKLMLPVGWPAAGVLKERRRWRVAADDGKTILFERDERPSGE
jgi:hypothetical protein